MFVVAGAVVALTGVVEPLAAGKPASLLLSLAEIALALVLFADASRIGLARLRRGVGIPTRLLGPGMLLSIGLGPIVGLWLFGALDRLRSRGARARSSRPRTRRSAPPGGGRRCHSASAGVDVEAPLDDGLARAISAAVRRGGIVPKGSAGVGLDDDAASEGRHRIARRRPRRRRGAGVGAPRAQCGWSARPRAAGDGGGGRRAVRVHGGVRRQRLHRRLRRRPGRWLASRRRGRRSGSPIEEGAVIATSSSRWALRRRAPRSAHLAAVRVRGVAPDTGTHAACRRHRAIGCRLRAPTDASWAGFARAVAVRGAGCVVLEEKTG